MSLDEADIGKLLRLWRAEKGQTQREVGELANLHRTDVSRMESGRSLTIPNLDRVLSALGKNLADLQMGIAQTDGDPLSAGEQQALREQVAVLVMEKTELLATVRVLSRNLTVARAHLADRSAGKAD